MTTTAPQGRLRAVRMLATLSALMAFAAMSTDFYLPAMPAMARALGAAPGQMEWTVSAFLIGVSLGQLAWGPVSDRIGRKPPVYTGLALFLAGTVGCAMADSVPAIIVWRVLQAVGACAGIVLSRAIVRDMFSGDRAVEYLTTLFIVMMIAPIIGPLVGAQLLKLAGWRAIFWMLFGVGLVVTLAFATLPETLPPERRTRASPLQALRIYRDLIGDRRVLVPAMTVSLFYFGIFAFVAGSPQVFIGHFGLAPGHYGLIFGSSTIGVAIAGLLNRRLTRRHGAARVLRGAVLVAGLAAILCLAAAITGLGGLWGFAVPLLLFVATNGMVAANALGLGMEHFPDRAGSVSALMGALHYGGGIFGSAFVGLIADGTAVPLGIAVAVAGIVCAIPQLLGSIARTRPGGRVRAVTSACRSETSSGPP